MQRVKIWTRTSFLSFIKHLCFTAARDHYRLVRYSFQRAVKPLFMRRWNLSAAYSKPKLSCNPAGHSSPAADINSSKSWRHFMSRRVRQRHLSKFNERRIHREERPVKPPSLYRCTPASVKYLSVSRSSFYPKGFANNTRNAKPRYGINAEMIFMTEWLNGFNSFLLEAEDIYYGVLSRDFTLKVTHLLRWG